MKTNIYIDGLNLYYRAVQGTSDRRVVYGMV